MKYVILAISILVFIPGTLVFADLEDDTEIYLKKGNKFFNSEKFEVASSAYDKVLEIDPNHVGALYNKGRTLIQLEKPEQAVFYFEKVLEIEPNHVGALTNKANDLVRIGKSLEAAPYFERVLQIKPNHVGALNYKADQLLMIGKSEEAVSYFERVIEIQPRYVDSLGKKVFDKVLAIEPNNPNALNGKGSSLVQLGRSLGGITIIYIDQIEEAVSYFDKALEIDPNHAGALFNKGRALAQMNKTEEGLSYIDKLLEIDPNNLDALSYKGDRLVGRGDLEEGMVYVDKVLNEEPEHIEALFNKASVFSRQHNHSEALTLYDKILILKPDFAIAEQNLDIAAKFVGYKKIDGFMEAMLRDSEGNLVAHMKIPKLKALRHEISTNFINEWPVKKIINREGQDYEVLQYERTAGVQIYSVRGGAAHYGITHPIDTDVWRIYANYWQYIAQPGDKVTFVYTVFRPTV